MVAGSSPSVKSFLLGVLMMKVFAFLCVCFSLFCFLTVPALGSENVGDSVPLEIEVQENSDLSEEVAEEGDVVLSVETEEGEEESSDPSADSENESDSTLPEEVPLEDTPEEDSIDDESELAQQIEEIAEKSRSDELGLGLNASCAFGYQSHGVDNILLEYFYPGHIASQDFSVSYSSWLYLAVTNLISIGDDWSLDSDLGDRTNFTIRLRKEFGSLCWTLQHQWVHTNHRMNEDFYYADRHRTSIQSGMMFGPLHPYLFVLSDVPAYTPVDEMMIYGGGGVALSVPINLLNTKIEIGASASGSLFWYYREPVLLYRLYAGFKTTVGGLSIHPEVSHLTDTDGGNIMAITVGVAF